MLILLSVRASNEGSCNEVGAGIGSNGQGKTDVGHASAGGLVQSSLRGRAQRMHVGFGVEPSECSCDCGRRVTAGLCNGGGDGEAARDTDWTLRGQGAGVNWMQ